MCLFVFRFNSDPNHWCRKICESLEDFFTNNFKKVEVKLNKQIEKYFIDPNSKEIRLRLQPNELGRRELEEEEIRLKELGR